MQFNTATAGLEQFTPFATGLDHPEGIAWDPDANVLYAGGEAGQLYSVDEGGAVTQVADTGAFMLGLALDAAGRVYACAGSQVVRVTPSDGSVESYATGTDEEPMRTPNYPAFGSGGTLYVTDSGTWDGDDGLIYRVDPGGECQVWTRALASFPNGCCLAPEGDALLVIQSTTPGLWRVPIDDGGAAGIPEQVCALPDTVPDGVAVDADGQVYISCFRPDHLYRVDRDGGVELIASDPRGVVLNQPTNVAFVGAHLDRLACASLGGWSIVTGDVGARGLPLPRPAITD